MRSSLLGSLLLGLAACGPGLLSDPSFGSGGDDEAEAGPGPGEAGTQGSAGSQGESASSADQSEVADDAFTSASTSAGTSASEGADTSASEGVDTSASQGTSASEGVDTSASASEGVDTSASTIDGSSADTSSAEDGNWGIPPDVTNEPCDPLAQDCFPTHKCVPYATVPGSTFLDGNKCMPILGDKAWGEACTLSNFNEAQDDCDGLGFCWDLEWVQGELQGSCVPFCVGTPQNLTCPPGWGCLFSGAIALCAQQCNPLLQDCPNQYACYWVNEAFQCVLTGSLGQDAEPCDQVNDCIPGLGCVAKASVPGCPGNAATCCTPYCELAAPDCPPGRACVAFFDQGEAPPGYESLGICIAP